MFWICAFVKGGTVIDEDWNDYCCKLMNPLSAQTFLVVTNDKQCTVGPVVSGGEMRTEWRSKGRSDNNFCASV